MKKTRLACIFVVLLPLWLAAPGSRARATEPAIVGSLRFSNQVCQALKLLKTHDTNAYAIVTNYVGKIREGERSGMWADQTPPVYELSDRTAFYSVTWCAATMAHDSFHSKLYHDYLKARGGLVPDAAWTGTVAEQKCMRHQLAVMPRIGASPTEIAHAEKMADGHYMKDHETMDDFKSAIGDACNSALDSRCQPE